MVFVKYLSTLLAMIALLGTNLYWKVVGEPKKPECPSALSEQKAPKKYFTLNFDDGITQDIAIMNLCKKYNFKGCTFNINTGLLGENWDWVGKAINHPDVTHLRFTKEQLKTGIYNGFDVEVHTLHHPSLSSTDNNPLKLWQEVALDSWNIYRYTGTMPLGMAWPGGSSEYTEKTIENIIKYTDIRFSRETTPTGNFSLPQYFMQWYPTCSITQSDVLSLAQQFLDATCEEDMLFFVWGHGYELDALQSYGVLEKLIKMMAEAEDVECVTASEFYFLFHDKIPSWK